MCIESLSTSAIFRLIDELYQSSADDLWEALNEVLQERVGFSRYIEVMTGIEDKYVA